MNNRRPEPMDVDKTATTSIYAGTSMPQRLRTSVAMFGRFQKPNSSADMETDLPTIAHRSGIIPPRTKKGAVDIEACRLDVQRAAVAKILSRNSTTIRQCLLHVGFDKEQASNRTMQMRVRRQVQRMIDDLQNKGGSGQSNAAQILAQLQQTPANAPRTSSQAMSPLAHNIRMQNMNANNSKDMEVSKKPDPNPSAHSSKANIPFKQIRTPLRKESSDEISALTADNSGANTSTNNVMSNMDEPAHGGSLGTSLAPQVPDEKQSNPSLPSSIAAPTDEKSHHKLPSWSRLSSIDSIPTIPMTGSFNGQDSFNGFNSFYNASNGSHQIPPRSSLQRRESSRSSRRSFKLGDDFDLQSAKNLLQDLQGFVSDDQTASSDVKIFES